ncbi:MAG: hypothetical protein AAGG44_04590 [Planctomycetota bacterium]
MSEMHQTFSKSESTSASTSSASEQAMPNIARRSLMLGAIPAGALGLLASNAQAQDGASGTDESNAKKSPGKEAVSGSADRAAVLKAGMTEQEADCWRKIADAAGAFFQLPELHPMDATEVASAVHIIQNKLLSRPTYRAYLAAHKAAAGESQVPGAAASTESEAK